MEKSKSENISFATTEKGKENSVPPACMYLGFAVRVSGAVLSTETKLPYTYLSIYLPTKRNRNGGFKGVTSW